MSTKLFALILTLFLGFSSIASLPVQAQDECSRRVTPLVERVETLYGIPYSEFGLYYCQGITITAIAQSMYLETLTGQSYQYWLNLLANPTEYSAILASFGYSIADISPAKALGRN